MPDSRREIQLKAVVAALSQDSVTVNSVEMTKPDGLQVHRHTTRPATNDDLPDQTVFIADEPTENDATGVDDRQLAIRIRSRTTWTSAISGDEALDPLLTWAELVLLADHTLGGVSNLVEYNGLVVDAEERADPYAEAFQEFVITYQTRHGDPRTAP